MAIVQNLYTGDGATVLYSLSFPYIDQADVKVKVNNVLVTNYVFATASSIQFTSAPANGASIKIYRLTDTDDLESTIFPGSAIKAQDLNDNFTQSLYAVQESIFEAGTATTTANTALTNSNTAISTANGATSTANTALSNSTAAVSTANAASAAASSAVSTANTASSNASSAVSTANAASSAAASAVSTANSAAATVATAYLKDGSVPMTGNVATGGFRITNVGTPTASSDATTKGYVDGLVLSGTIPDGDKGDITTSSGSTVWTVDNGAITSAKLGSNLTVDLASGSAASPSLTFDADTGLYSPGADQVAISTGGSERARIDSSGRLLVGTSTARANFENSTDTAGVQVEAAQTGANVNIAHIVGHTNGAIGPSFLFARHRSSSIGGTTVVAADDRIGRISFQGSDGTEFVEAASITSAVDGTPGTNDMPGRLVFSTTADGASSPTERVRLDSSGRLLVGTTASISNLYRSTTSAVSPTLQIENATNSYNNGYSNINYSASGFAPVLTLGLSKSNTQGTNTVVASGDELGYIHFVGADGTNFRTAAWIRGEVDGTPGSGDMPGRLVFSTTADGANTPTERMRINNSGRIDTFASSTSQGISVGSAAGAGTTYAFIEGVYSRSSNASGGTPSFYVYTNGNVQNTNNSYTAISDIKLKENIVDANSQWGDLKALRVRNYNLKEGQTHKQIGLIAQEVEPISPGLVYESPDRDAEGNDLGTVTKSVNYSVLYMKAVKALQEAMERIETLETKVAALEAA